MVEIVSEAEALTVMLRACEAEAPFVSDTLTVRLVVPVAPVGVPVMVPPLRLSPVGNEPLGIENVNGAAPVTRMV